MARAARPKRRGPQRAQKDELRERGRGCLRVTHSSWSQTEFARTRSASRTEAAEWLRVFAAGVPTWMARSSLAERRAAVRKLGDATGGDHAVAGPLREQPMCLDGWSGMGKRLAPLQGYGQC